MRKVKQIKVVCKTCGEIFNVQPSEMKKSQKKGYEVGYCNRDCFWVAHAKLRKKLGGFAKGKTWTHTEDYKRRLSLARTGEKNPMWINGSSLYRIRRKTHLVNKWRKAVFMRDSYTCQECGAKNGNGKTVVLNAHHIKFWSKYPKLRYVVSNGVAECEKCHRYIHRFERLFEKSLNLL